MNTKDLKLLKQKLQTLNELETKERDKYLRDIALGKNIWTTNKLSINR